MMMNFKKVAGAGIAAVTFSLMASSAMATFTGTAPAYATQGIPASGAVTIPANAIVYTTDVTAPAANVGTGNYTVVFTLPAGVTFTTTPAITVTGATGTATLSAGGNGSNSVTFLVNITTGAAAPILTFGTFGITGATALASPKTGITFPITEQITATAVTNIPVQPAPTATAGTGALATSASALTVAIVGPPSTLNIDINPTANGTKFFQGAPQADTIVADDGSLAFTIPNGTLAANGTAFAFTSSTVTETYSGATGGISAAYLNPTNAACNVTAAGEAGVANVVTGTINGTGIIFAGIPVVGNTGIARELCLYTAGTTLLAANPVGFTVTTSIDSTSLAAIGFNPYNYNGTVVTYPYAVNTSSSYASYIRIINKSTSTPAVVTASVISDQGGVGVVQVESGLAANGNDLVPMSTITSNAGLTNTSGRYSITLFGPGTGTNPVVPTVSFENLLLNPGGVVTQLQ